uniref:Uncharacterized protein n=1 Tax=Spongospora subterranea TaxID=70186 RepID=A0A0H5RDB3_9EUKA|eukprot:CRZ11736.1 hypothetical protein [Spongospora subterranea]
MSSNEVWSLRRQRKLESIQYRFLQRFGVDSLQSHQAEEYFLAHPDFIDSVLATPSNIAADLVWARIQAELDASLIHADSVPVEPFCREIDTNEDSGKQPERMWDRWKPENDQTNVEIDEWSQVIECQRNFADAQAERLREEERRKRHLVGSELLRQMQTNEERLRKSREETSSDLRQIKEGMERSFRAEQQSRRDAAERKAKIQADMTQMLETKSMQKQLQREAAMNEEKNLLKQCHKKERELRKSEAMQKAKQREAFVILARQNDEMNASKERARSSARAEDVERIRAYERNENLLRQKESERKRMRQEKQTQSEAIGQIAQQQRQDEIAAEMKKIQYYQQLKEQKQDEQIRREKQRHNERAEQCKTENFKLLKEKEARLRLQKEEILNERQVQGDIQTQYQQELRDSQSKLVQRQSVNRESLMQQIDDNRRRSSNAMTEVERQINSRYLRAFANGELDQDMIVPMPIDRVRDLRPTRSAIDKLDYSDSDSDEDHQADDGSNRDLPARGYGKDVHDERSVEDVGKSSHRKPSSSKTVETRSRSTSMTLPAKWQIEQSEAGKDQIQQKISPLSKVNYQNRLIHAPFATESDRNINSALEQLRDGQ